MSTGEERRPERVAKQAIEAAAAAYYQHSALAASGARERAQTAFTMTSAVAAGFTALGVFTGISSDPTLVQTLAVLAVIAWLLSSALYLYAAVGEYWAKDEQPEKSIARTPEAFIDTVYDDIRGERDAVYDRLRRAVLVSFFALAFTGMTVASAVFDKPTDDPHATIELTSGGIKAIKAACGSLSPLNDLRVERSTLDHDVIIIDPPEKSCGQASELALPRGEVAAIALR
jgi:hypothetical protein